MHKQYVATESMNILTILSAAILLVSAGFIGLILWVAAGEADVNGDPENDSKN